MCPTHRPAKITLTQITMERQAWKLAMVNLLVNSVGIEAVGILDLL